MTGLCAGPVLNTAVPSLVLFHAKLTIVKVGTACQCRIATWHQTQPLNSKAQQCTAAMHSTASGLDMASAKAQMTKLQLTLLGPSNLSCAHRRLGEHKDKQKKQGMASAQSVQSRCIFARRVRCLESPSSTELWQPQLPRPKPAPAGLAAGCL